MTSLAGLALHLQRGPDGLGALAHNAQSHVVCRDVGGVKATPVVVDAQLRAQTGIAAAFQADLDLWAWACLTTLFSASWAMR